MKRNKKGQYEQQFDEPTIIKFYAEKYDIDWLREQKLRRKITMSEIIRYALKNLKRMWNEAE